MRRVDDEDTFAWTNNDSYVAKPTTGTHTRTVNTMNVHSKMLMNDRHVAVEISQMDLKYIARRENETLGDTKTTSTMRISNKRYEPRILIRKCIRFGVMVYVTICHQFPLLTV